MFLATIKPALAAIGPTKATEDFINSLVKQDWDAVQNQTIGHAKTTIVNRKSQAENISTADVVDMDVKVLTATSKWSKVQVRMETKLTTGEYDVLWYNLYLVNNNDGWKVYRVQITMPNVTSSPGIPINIGPNMTTEKENIKTTYANYLQAISEKQYNNASNLLVGYAKQVFEMELFVYKNNPPFNQYEVNDVKLLWQKNKIATVKIHSIIDSRPVQTLVTVYSTTNGWKIADIATL